MQIGCPQSLATPYGTADLNSARVNTDGFLVQYVSGNDFPTIRNPVDNRPNSPGAIVHPFFYGPVIIVIQGLVVGSTPAGRQVLGDFLLGCSDSILQADGTYSWTEPGQPTRSRTVRLYDAEEILGQGSGDASPKMFTLTLIAGTPSEAY